eukprot:5466906-Pleurochrysis_carterae.AAC.2
MRCPSLLRQNSLSVACFACLLHLPAHRSTRIDSKHALSPFGSLAPTSSLLRTNANDCPTLSSLVFQPRPHALPRVN